MSSNTYSPNIYIYKLLPNRFLRPLGAGQFGSVDSGIWKKGNQDIPVALKTLKKESSPRDKLKFLQEAAVMAQFRHPNVVTLFGIVSEGEPVSTLN